ncbi:MAG TPA: hypothetical protein VMX94_00760 [Armatimonadota bacterium]|nr:hypothetical protein [Armatimonadota bacterium]
MQEELANAINCIRTLRRINKYEGNRIGKLKTLPRMPASFTYQVGDIILFADDGECRVRISRPWREVQIQTHPGCTQLVGAETIIHVPKDCVEEYDSAQIPQGLYESSYGVGRVILHSIDQLACNGHREAAFLLLLNVIAGLSRRRYPVPETPEGLKDSKKYNKQINAKTVKRDREAFVAFVNEELQKLQNEHPEYGLDFSDMSFCTMDSKCGSVGEWIYDYFRCVLVHNTKTSSTYQLDMSSDALISQFFDIDKKKSRKCIAFGFHQLLRRIVASAEENDESF